MYRKFDGRDYFDFASARFAVRDLAGTGVAVATFELRDGELGDSDPRSGVIGDPGGPAVPARSGAVAVPALAGGPLVLLAVLLTVLGGFARRRWPA